MTTATLERTEGMALLNKAIATIKEDIEEAGGIFNIQQQVRFNVMLVDRVLLSIHNNWLDLV